MCIPLPFVLFPVYQLFLAVASIANFGVRLYVSAVTGGSTTTRILSYKAVLKNGVSDPNFR
jgi:hypothetical protein